ncbi:hypothetical protein [Longimycelium tulufanense]|nr:hypothetical protein [Longimycelium tulufanense]
MPRHLQQGSWWDRHDAVMWSIATAYEHWAWIAWILLLVVFTGCQR